MVPVCQVSCVGPAILNGSRQEPDAGKPSRRALPFLPQAVMRPVYVPVVGCMPSASMRSYTAIALSGCPLRLHAVMIVLYVRVSGLVPCARSKYYNVLTVLCSRLAQPS